MITKSSLLVGRYFIMKLSRALLYSTTGSHYCLLLLLLPAAA